MSTRWDGEVEMNYGLGGIAMSHLVRSHKFVSGLWTGALIVVVMSLASCNKSDSKAEDSKTAQTMFASPADAGAAFLAAAKSGDQGALLAIFGPDAKDVLFSGDAVKDKDGMQDFVAAYGQMNRWQEIK